jgi:cytochrome c peroxidase
MKHSSFGQPCPNEGKVSLPRHTELAAVPPAGVLAQPKSTRQVGLPEAVTRAAMPPDNPQTPEKIALGQKLFFDGRLSVEGTVACSTCPDPARAFTDGNSASIGVEGVKLGEAERPYEQSPGTAPTPADRPRG